MKQHEREFFVYRIRSGKYFIDYNNIRLKIITPTIDEQFEAENSGNIIQDFTKIIEKTIQNS